MTATTVMKSCAMLISKANCIARDIILFSKLLDVSEVFETFMYAITSHKKQRAKYQREMLSHIEKTTLSVKRSNYKVMLPAKKNTLRLKTPIINCDNADGHSQTGVIEKISASTIRKQREAP